MGQVSSFVLRNVEARRFVKPEPKPVQVRIDNNLAVTFVRPTGPDTCQIEFSYTAAYGALGVIKIEGEFTYQGPLATKTAEEWEAKRQMPGEAAGEIHTTIMHACIPEAVTLAKAIHLPPPIPLPTVQFNKQQEAGKPGAAPSAGPSSHGPEVQ